MNDKAAAPKRQRARRSVAGVKLDDVAKVVGVSTATVSRAVNQPARVSEEVRARVIEAAERLGWVPNAAGKALASLRTFTVGVIIPTLSHENFAVELEFLQEALARAGYTVLVAFNAYDHRLAYHQTRTLLERGVEGIVLLGESYEPKLFELLEVQQIPYVTIYSFDPSSARPSIGVDNRSAFRQLTEYLVRMGHREIGLIAQSTEGNDRAMARISGVMDVLKENGLRMRDEHMVVSHWSVGEGRQCFRQIMSTSFQPTALVCTNDYFAIGALIESSTMGIRVPHDLSIVGFDDLEIAKHFNPPLTTMRSPDREIGASAARMLVDRIEGRAPPLRVELPAELVVRGSSGPPSAPRD